MSEVWHKLTSLVKILNYCGQMEPPVRIELTTFRLQGGCSTTELGRPFLPAHYVSGVGNGEIVFPLSIRLILFGGFSPLMEDQQRAQCRFSLCALEYSISDPIPSTCR